MAIEAIVERPEPKRFPRVEEDCDLMLTERARLEAQAWRLFTTRDKVRLELGRTFIRIKATFRHGEWTAAYYTETFNTSGVSFRTIQRWMQKARRDHADSEHAIMSFFKPATDEGALRTDDATARAEAEVGGTAYLKPKPERVRLEGPAVYKLPLHLKGDERDACDALRKSAEWPCAEQKILALLKQLCAECGIVNSNPDNDGGSNPK